MNKTAFAIKFNNTTGRECEVKQRQKQPDNGGFKMIVKKKLIRIYQK